MQRSAGNEADDDILDAIERACLDDGVDRALLDRARAFDQREIGPRARARYLHANVLYRLDHDDEAYALFQQAVRLAQVEGDARTHAMAILRLVDCDAHHERWDEATSRVDEALWRTRAIGDWHLIARAENVSGHIEVSRRRWQDAASAYGRARDAYGAAGRSGEALDALRAARVCQLVLRLGECELADGEAIAADAGLTDAWAYAMYCRGLHLVNARPDIALSLLRRAVASSELMGREAASATLNISACLGLLGRPEEAEREARAAGELPNATPRIREQAWMNAVTSRLERNLTISRDDEHRLFDDTLLNSSIHEAQLRIARAIWHGRSGAPEAAIAELDACGPTEALPNAFAVGVEQLLAHLLMHTGRLDEAADFLRALSARELTPVQSATRLLRMGLLLFMREDYSEAAATLHECHETVSSQLSGHPMGALARSLELRARWFGNEDDDSLLSEIDAFVAEEDVSDVAVALSLTTRAWISDDPVKAKESAERFVELGLLDDAVGLFGIAARLQRDVDPDAARATLLRATEVLDDALELAPDDQSCVQMQERSLEIRGHLVASLAKTSPHDALAQAIRAKSSAFLRLLARARMSLGAGEQPPLLSLAPLSLEETPLALADMALRSTSANLVQLAHTRALYRQHTRTHRAHGALERERAISIDQIIAAVPVDAALVEMFPHEEVLYGFVLSRAQGLQMVATPLPVTFEGAYRSALRYFQPGPIAGRHHDARMRAALRHLYETLIEPLVPRIGSAERLILSPGALLARVPFLALRASDGTALLDRFEISMVLSAAQIAMPKPPLPPHLRATLVRGHDGTRPLAAADREVALLGEALTNAGVRAAVLGKDAPRADVERAMQHAEIFHFSGHAGFLDEEGMAAHLATAGTPLTAAEVLGLNLGQVRLAVLSACETGRTSWESGHEFVGLLRAFFAAGAHCLICSNWLADDASTAATMQQTYARWLRGERLSAALRAAQLALRAEREQTVGSAHPFFWANFVQYGVEATRLHHAS